MAIAVVWGHSNSPVEMSVQQETEIFNQLLARRRSLLPMVMWVGHLESGSSIVSQALGWRQSCPVTEENIMTRYTWIHDYEELQDNM